MTESSDARERIARKLGVLAECLVCLSPKDMTRGALDDIIHTMRDGEKEIVKLTGEARIKDAYASELLTQRDAAQNALGDLQEQIAQEKKARDR